MNRRQFAVTASAGFAALLGHKVGLFGRILGTSSTKFPGKWEFDGKDETMVLNINSEDPQMLIEWCRNLIGKVNGKQIDKAAPETLIAQSMTVDTFMMPSGSKHYVGVTRFKYRPEGWQGMGLRLLRSQKLTTNLYEKFYL